MTKAGTFVAQYGSRRTGGVLRMGGWLRTLLSGCALPVGFALLSGCTLQMYSPPARMAPTELSSNMDKGEFEVIANSGGHLELAGLSLVESAHAQASVAYGVTERAAVQVSGSYVRVQGQEDVDHRVSQNIVAFRAGVGFSPTLPRQFLRFTFGVGGGSWAGGGFYSPDFGINLAYDNRFVVPFFNSSFWISFPGESADVRLRYADSVESGETDEFGDPILVDGFKTETFPVETTTGRSLSLGVAIRIRGWTRHVDWAAGDAARGTALVFALQNHGLRSSGENLSFWGLTGGIMHRF